ncbi:MAG: alpha-L-rhamnosidase C-terminal domain-containing protein [Bacteroidales bacterium]|nr:alpha-L-rhamnosidase C-terminal domain-containing protein [Bacteroidales bacterium]MDY6002588.1 alpha-L-rhamnosidase C-terminal domain-containing protein [Candidatus Cryptobacteroides sp.]
MNHTTHLFAIASILATCLSVSATGQGSIQRKETEFVSDYVTPSRIVLSKGSIMDAGQLLMPYSGQVTTTEKRVATFKTTGEVKASILLDFGQEMQGGLQIVRAISSNQKPVRFRICFGESVSEALSSVDESGATATNDHAMRDFEASVPWLGTYEYGNTGFRFVRLDLLSEDVDVPLVAVRAISRYRNIPYSGAFKCSDERLNQIWDTGARTVHLNMQDYLWDGIKRDRLVWIGDMHPEVMTVNTVFGNHSVVRKSLDFVRDGTSPTKWMNGICSYSLWWIIIQRHLYWYYGDKEYLQEQHDYLQQLVRTVIANVDGSKENYESGRFLDWPSNDKPAVVHAGLQAITVQALEAASDMAGWLGDEDLLKECSETARKMHGYVPDHAGSKQAAALLSLAGMYEPREAAEIIMEDGASRFSSFMGYYMIEALAKSGYYSEAMDLISEYWGKMIDLGATTFWEDFNYDDAANAARIDEVVPEGKFDIHANGGAYCYVGLRHSFCHGWASGPTTWLSEHVLGVEPVAPGFRKIRISPHLGKLDWAEGTVPTPYGAIKISVKKDSDGKPVTSIDAPDGIEIVK